MSDIILTLKDDISIRRYRESDAGEMARHANNRKIWKNLTDRFPHPYTPEDAQWWINHNKDMAQWLSTISPSDMRSSETKEVFEARRSESMLPTSYAVCHLDVPIGSCGIEPDPLKAPRSVNMGYWLGEDFWGRGIATQVSTHFSQWIFEAFPWIVRVEGDAYSWNQGSQKVLRKSGFEYEGVQKLRVFKDGKYGDLVLFAKIRPNFEPVLMETNDP